MRRSGSCLLLLAMLSAAQPPQTASVRGTVTNSLTGGPLPRAHVMLQNGHARLGAMTDGDGKFSITGIAPGNYSATAEHVGFVKSPMARGLELRAGQEESSLELKLPPVGALTGRVLDAAGEPVQGATVLVQRGGDEETDTTDNKGQYRIGGLAPGKYRVRAWMEESRPPEIRTDGSKEVHYMATFYPGVPTSKEATRVAVAAGAETTGIDIPLLATPIVRVSGKVRNIPDGAKDVQIEAVPVDNPESGFQPRLARPDGSFVIWALDPGKYSVSASVQMGGSEQRSAPVEVEVGTGNIEGVELRMVAPFELAGQVLFEDDRAKQEGARQAMQRRVFLRPVNGRGPDAQAEIGPDDSFQLAKVQPGRYEVEVSVPSGGYVRSLRMGTVQADGNVVDMSNGAGGGSLTLLVSAAMGEISGTVSDSKGPVAGAMVMVMQGSNTAEGLQTDAQGKYSSRRLRPGTYKLLAGGEELLALWNRGTLEDYEERVATVELHAGDKLTQDLKK